MFQEQRRFDRRIEQLRTEAFLFVCRVLQATCDRHDWDVSTASTYVFTPRGGKTEIENITTQKLCKLVDWYEGEFGNFPQCMYKGGVWYPEDMLTPVMPPKKKRKI